MMGVDHKGRAFDRRLSGPGLSASARPADARVHPVAHLDRRGRREDRSSMGDVIALPLPGAVALPDVRGEHRAMQVTWHERDSVFVVSMWRSGCCVASVHLAPVEAAALIGALADGLAGRSRA